MNNTKLVNVLRTFSKSEMKDFEKWVSSPFFNKGRNYLPFLKELKKFYPKFNDEKLTYEYLHSKLYPGKKFNRQILWNMNSALLNIAEEFLIYISLKKNRFSKTHMAAGEFLQRKLPDYYYRMLDEMESSLDSIGINHNYFLYKSQLESARKEYYSAEDKLSLGSQHTVKVGEYSILYFLWNIVEVINDMQVDAYMFNAKFDINIPREFLKNLKLENLIDYSKKKNYRYAWIMEMYYSQIKMMLEKDGSKHFFRLKELFEQHYDKFTKEEKFNWITCLINYCTWVGDTYRKTLFEIHQFELKEELAFTGRNLSKTHFLQILKNAIAINETKWTKNFIDEFVPKLKHSNQKPMRALGLALLYLKLKDYEKVLESLSRVNFTDTKDKLVVKSIYVRAYFDLNETEVLFSNIDSALHFIDNNKAVIPDEIADNYRKFLKLLRKLKTAKENDQYSEIEEIRKITEEDKNLIFGDWLLEKIEENKKRS